MSQVVPSSFDLDAEILAVQAMAEQVAETTSMGYHEITKAQNARLQIVFEAVLGKVVRALRIAVMQSIYPCSGRTGQPVQSFKDLSRAQAHALITEFFGHDGLTLDSQVTDHGRELLLQLKKRVLTQGQPALA